MSVRRIVSLALSVLVPLSLQADPDPDRCLPQVVIEKELAITDPSVLHDRRTVYPGPWSFGYLMAQLAGETDLARPRATTELIERWLDRFETVTRVSNGARVKPRPAMKRLLLEPWPRLDRRTLDLRRAPFQLLAVTNRVDLKRENSGPHARDGQAGEGRFVFQWTHPADGSPLLGTVIFEYRLPLTAGKSLRKWVDDWHDLRALPFGPSFNRELEKVTHEFTTKQYPDFVRGIALNQLRTNEIALDLVLNPASPVWELREFHLESSGYLEQVPVKQTPDLVYNTETELDTPESLTFKELLRRNGATADLPETVPAGFPVRKGAPFLAASALVQTSIANPDPRGLPNANFRFLPKSTSPPHRLASLGTCNGCHAGETSTAFLHLSLPFDPATGGFDRNGATQKSAFLTQDLLARKQVQECAIRQTGCGRRKPITDCETSTAPYLARRARHGH